MKIVKLEEAGRIIAPPDSQKMKSGYVILQPGEEVGHHRTSAREEIIVILEGTATIWEEGTTETVEAGNVVYIAPEKHHNVLNKSDKPLKYIYIVALMD